MTGDDTKGWVARALGSEWERIQGEAVVAICAAHAEAVAAQDSQGSRANDTYGHTLKVRQHELLNERLGEVPGIALRRPQGVQSRFHFPVIDETNTVIVPLRFSNDPKVRHDDVTRIDLSDLRRALLAGVNPPEEPNLIELATDEDCDARYLEELAAYEELVTAGRAVVIGFGSTPGGIFDIGLGDLLVEDADSGAVSWRRWHPLRTDLALSGISATPTLRSVGPAEEARQRFDATDPTEGLNLRLRPATAEAPDPEAQTEGTATEQPQHQAP